MGRLLLGVGEGVERVLTTLDICFAPFFFGIANPKLCYLILVHFPGGSNSYVDGTKLKAIKKFNFIYLLPIAVIFYYIFNDGTLLMIFRYFGGIHREMERRKFRMARHAISVENNVDCFRVTRTEFKFRLNSKPFLKVVYEE